MDRFQGWAKGDLPFQTERANRARVGNILACGLLQLREVEDPVDFDALAVLM